MENSIRYSARASLAVVGMCSQQMGLWKTIGEEVKIKQKTVTHSPLQKLQDAFINILAGGQGIVEINRRVKTDESLLAAFGRQGCADQSGVSTTLNACQAENVEQMRRAMQEIYRRYGAAYKHPYGQLHQLLDVDMSGMPAGGRGEGVETGYFADKSSKRGRQVGRTYATLYDEVVSERLYTGKTQLNRSLMELVTSAETVLNLNSGFRKRTILRMDGGGGNDADINWVLSRDYLLLVKMTHWKRVDKLTTTICHWHTDPKDPRRQAAWVELPFAYDQPTRQLAVRCQGKTGNWHTAILVFNLQDHQLAWLCQQGKHPITLPHNPLWLAVYAYDLRGGGVEASFRGSKQGLRIVKRNKNSFAAQEILLLLAQLAYNLITWTRNGLAACLAKVQQFGILRMVRDAFHIPGCFIIDSQGHIIQISLNQTHDLAASFRDAFAAFLARDGTSIILHKI